MAVLMIKCPRTGQDVSTGILTNSGSDQRSQTRWLEGTSSSGNP
jgi:hypothetical protein